MGNPELRDSLMGNVGQGRQGVEHFRFRHEVIFDKQGIEPVARQCTPHVQFIDLLSGDPAMFDEGLPQLNHQMVGE
jgi:hypothetical protein